MIGGKDKINKDIKTKPTFTVLCSNQCLKLDKNKINFCKYPIFASSFKQITLNVDLLDYFVQHQRKDFHLLKIKVSLNSSCRNLTDDIQKIFTIKIIENADEVDQLEIPIKAQETLSILIRANIPELQVSTDINGSLELQIDDLTPMILPIVSRGQVPQIICLKQMQNIKTGTKIIKIPSKNIMKLPFKNCSNINFFFQVKLIGKDIQKAQNDGVRLKVIANQPINKFEEDKNKNKDNIMIKIDANSAFYVTLQFELLKKDGTIRIARRILILQVQGSKLLFPFPLQVIISD